MKIKALTPNRIDLAGGTLDLYPIYLMEDGGLTVNFAIDMYCSVTLETREDKEIHIYSVDLDEQEGYESIDSMATDGKLGIVARGIKFFRPTAGLNVTTENRVRQGSGLGASSSLLMAALGALNDLTGAGYGIEKLINHAADLEAQCIRVPTGKQDYYAAMYGGVNALWFEVNGNRREMLLETGDDIQELEDRIILSFTGEPRASGITNWGMIKNYLDDDPTTVAGMKRIKDVAVAMRECILDRNWRKLANMVEEEWKNRRTLADGVTNEAVERLMDAALSAGALANKLCGAGGGGCMLTWAEPDKRSRVETALTAAGAEVLPFKVVTKGIIIERLP